MEDEADTKECCEVKLDNYDESSYPANAESESDGEGLCGSEEHLSSALPLEREGILTAEDSVALCDDVLCVVCAEILVEPCSLHCGHSFCQLCLASLWKSHGKKLPLYLQCPVCRQPWVHFPGVNIQLRSIIEKNHKALIDGRCADFSESDRSTLAQFKRAKDGEWQKERGQTRHLRPTVWIMVFMALLFCGLVAMLTAVILSVATFSGSTGKFVQRPVMQWTNADVMDWLAGLGDWAADKNISRVFLKERITGAQLKLLNQSTLKRLGVNVDYFKTQSLLLAIEKLKQQDYVYPRNFNEFMAAHRKKTILIGIMYKLWPRFTFFCVYLFEYHDVFLPVWYYSVTAHKIEEDTASPSLELSGGQVLVFSLEVLLVPHYVVGLFAWHWFNLHPWICTAIIIHCMWATQNEAKKTISYIFTVTQINWRLKFSRTVRLFLKSVLIFFLALSGGLVVWPIVPYFLCDGIFYLVVWNTVYTRLLALPWKLFRRRRVNLQHERNNVVMP